MINIKRKISLKDIFSLSRDGNKLLPFINEEWVDVDNSKELNTTYMHPVSDILNPLYNKLNINIGLNNIKYISYQDCKRIYTILQTFQSYIGEVCLSCLMNKTNDFYNFYINKLDEYIIYGGINMLIEMVDLFNVSLNVSYENKEKKLKYFSVNEDKKYIDFILEKESIFLGKEISSEIILKYLNPNLTADEYNILLNNFYKEYYLSTNKILLIKNLLNNYLIEGDINFNSLYETQREEISGRVDIYTEQFYNETHNCISDYKIIKSNITHNKNAYIRINLSFEENFEDLGLYSNSAQEWVAGRTYYIGDFVLFNGNTYILVAGDKNNSFSGYYVEAEKEVYFDEVELYPDTGFAKNFIMNGVDYVHWMRSVRPSNEFITIAGRIESQLHNLRSNRGSDETTFFDIEGRFKKGKKYNETFFKELDGSFTKYYSIIDDIILKINNGVSGKDTLEYHYYIDRSDKNKGIKLTDIYERYVLNYTKDGGILKDNKYVVRGVGSILYNGKKYNPEEIIIGVDGVPYFTKNGNVNLHNIKKDFRYVLNETVYSESLNGYIYNRTLSNIEYNINNVNNIYNEQEWINPYNYTLQKADERKFNHQPLTRQEYLIGTFSEPEVEFDILIDRGINRAWDKHLKLNEINTLDDLLTYGNGFFKVKE